MKITVFNDDTVSALQPKKTIWDKEVVSGLGARRQRITVSYILKTRGPDRRQRMVTLGRHGAPLTVATARLAARRVLAAVLTGRDLQPRVSDAMGAARPYVPIGAATHLDRLRAAVASPLIREAPRKHPSAMPPEVAQAEQMLRMVDAYLRAVDIDHQPLVPLMSALNDLLDGRTAKLFTPLQKRGAVEDYDNGKPGAPGLRPRERIDIAEVGVLVQLLRLKNITPTKAAKLVSEDLNGAISPRTVRRYYERTISDKASNVREFMSYVLLYVTDEKGVLCVPEEALMQQYKFWLGQVAKPGQAPP